MTAEERAAYVAAWREAAGRYTAPGRRPSQLGAWVIIASRLLSSWVDSLSDDRHLTTDPACQHYREPRGWRLDHASRGHGCYPCMRRRAFAPMNSIAEWIREG